MSPEKNGSSNALISQRWQVTANGCRPCLKAVYKCHPRKTSLDRFYINPLLLRGRQYICDHYRQVASTERWLLKNGLTVCPVWDACTVISPLLTGTGGPCIKPMAMRTFSSQRVFKKKSKFRAGSVPLFLLLLLLLLSLLLLYFGGIFLVSSNVCIYRIVYVACICTCTVCHSPVEDEFLYFLYRTINYLESWIESCYWSISIISTVVIMHAIRLTVSG